MTRARSRTEHTPRSKKEKEETNNNNIKKKRKTRERGDLGLGEPGGVWAGALAAAVLGHRGGHVAVLELGAEEGEGEAAVGGRARPRERRDHRRLPVPELEHPS
eukprot:32182-Rhodomonas_salina.1